MKYVAIYNSKEAVKLAKEGAISAVINDGYYAMYGPRDCGTGIVGRSSSGMCWGDYYIAEYGSVKTLNEFKPDDSWFKKVGTVGWRTSGGNYASVEFIDDHSVRVTLEGRRHGIPSYWHGFEELQPKKVEVYESWRTDASPWERDLLPKGEKLEEMAANIVTGLGYTVEEFEVMPRLKAQEVVDGIEYDPYDPNDQSIRVLRERFGLWERR